LIWAHSLEKCILSCFFPKGKKELELSFYQAIVLLCFNKNTQINFNIIKLETGIDDSELRLTLASLANGMLGTRVLCKGKTYKYLFVKNNYNKLNNLFFIYYIEPKGKEVNDTDNFIYNANFTNKLFRIKINSIQLKEKEAEESDRTIDEVFRDRHYQVDAIIVRTMKSRKVLTHNDLMAEMLTQLKFPARTSDLKKRIESLIERDYLQRDKDDNTKYNYMA
jgi:cullin-4